MFYKGYEISARVRLDDSGMINPEAEEIIVNIGDESYDQYHYFGGDELDQAKRYIDELVESEEK